VREQVEELARLALEDGVFGFFLVSDDADEIRRLAADIAPAVRELVETEHGFRSTGETDDVAPIDAGVEDATGPRAEAAVGEHERLGVTPTPDDGVRLAEPRWDESTRPHRPKPVPTSPTPSKVGPRQTPDRRPRPPTARAG
jgi:hypothetical protein